MSAKVPQYIDKTMYIRTDKGENSYIINTSYKGILRLSPNNSNSIYESDSVQFETDMPSYTDALTGENLGDADLHNRLIRVSESEGYMVNIRFGQLEDGRCQSIEFDTLNVSGITEVENAAVIYTNAKTNSEQHFVLNNTNMPLVADSDIQSRNVHDMLDLHITRNSDGTHGDGAKMLVGRASGSKRYFQLKNVSDIIKKYVEEGLMKLQTVPTGSIHHVPITISQWNSLNDSDLLKREYLLCDGSAYPTKDYPELARHLWGEKIQFWAEDTNHNLVLHEVINGDEDGKYSNNENVKVFNGESGDCDLASSFEYSTITHDEPYFRVPDLRRMFIRSVPTHPIDSHVLDFYESSTLATTGTWLPDNIPYFRNQTNNISLDKDEHFHFTHFGTYDTQSAGASFSYTRSSEYEASPQVAVLGTYFDDNASAVTAWKRYTRSSSGCTKYQGGNEADNWIYFLTAASDENATANLGTTSYETSNEHIITEKAVFNNDNSAFYVGPANNAGLENTPEHIICTSLIKI